MHGIEETCLSLRVDYKHGYRLGKGSRCISVEKGKGVIRCLLFSTEKGRREVMGISPWRWFNGGGKRNTHQSYITSLTKGGV